MNDLNTTKQCIHCKSDILTDNYLTHSIHCQRFFYCCLKCKLIVKVSEKTEHDDSEHKIIKCDKCCAQIEKYYLNYHLLHECLFRKVKCSICDIDVAVTEINEHEDYCGSRTEKCTSCQKYVMLKYKTQHITSNHVFFKITDEPGPSPLWKNGVRTLGDFLPNSSKKQKHNKLSSQNKNSSDLKEV